MEELFYEGTRTKRARVFATFVRNQFTDFIIYKVPEVRLWKDQFIRPRSIGLDSWARMLDELGYEIDEKKIGDFVEIPYFMQTSKIYDIASVKRMCYGVFERAKTSWKPTTDGTPTLDFGSGLNSICEDNIDIRIQKKGTFVLFRTGLDQYHEVFFEIERVLFPKKIQHFTERLAMRELIENYIDSPRHKSDGRNYPAAFGSYRNLVKRFSDSEFIINAVHALVDRMIDRFIVRPRSEYSAFDAVLRKEASFVKRKKNPLKRSRRKKA